jgi:hypothetical protein
VSQNTRHERLMNVFIFFSATLHLEWRTMQRAKPIMHDTAKQLTALGLGLLLGLALFISPLRLYELTSAAPSPMHQQGQEGTSSHSSHHSQSHTDVRCLRCVLQTFEAAESVQPLVVVFVVLGFFVVVQPLEPKKVITPSKTARGPPATLPCTL